MSFLKFFLVIAFSILFVTACKKKAEEPAAVTVPIDTVPKIDTIAINPDDTIAAMEEAPGMPPAPKGEGFAVQVASATDEAYARYLVDLWKGRGYEPFVSTISHNNETHYRVRLGLYQTEAETKKIVADLEDKYSLKSWIERVSY